MTEDPHNDTELADTEYQQFMAICQAAIQEIFDAAKKQEEVQFALALSPEFRGLRDAGWSTAQEAIKAFDEYLENINNMKSSNFQIRISLSFYSYLSEAAGLYEVPKNMLRIASGDGYSAWPFQPLVRRHGESGALIAPNANLIMKDLLGHARELGFQQLEATLIEAFDPIIRNAYAHGDYILWDDGIRLPARNGGPIRVLPYAHFTSVLNKAVGFFMLLREAISKSMRSYHPPVRVIGRLNNSDIPLPTIIAFDPEKRSFSIRNGAGL